MWQDLRHAVRLIGRQWLFTAVVCLTLALGIGANTAIFSIVDAALFRPLPFRDADRLVAVYRLAQTWDGQTTGVLIEKGEVDAVRAVTHVFEGVEVFGWSASRAPAAGTGRSLLVGGFSTGLPAFLGVQPELGRTFVADDVASQSVIVLSDGYWQHAFGRDPGVVGRTIAFTDRTCVVIGVMPPTFRYFVGAQADVWLPIGDRAGSNLAARLRPGLTVPQAQRVLDAAMDQAAVGRRPARYQIAPADWNRAQNQPRVMLLSLMASVGFVMLIACANVANLLLARLFSREEEIAVRRALGATPGQLTRQFLIEGVALASLGGVAAGLAGWWSIRAIPAMVPAKLSQWVFGVSLPQFDWRVSVFGAVCVLVTGLWCGLVPALRMSRTVAGLTSGHRIAGVSGSQRRVRDAFQAVQMALTVVLLVGAGLLVASVARMLATPRGFQTADLSYVEWSNRSAPSSTAAPPPSFAEQVAARIAVMPGVRGVAMGPAPVSTGVSTFQFAAAGRPADVMVLRADTYFVGPNYFDVAGIALRAGRTFDGSDLVEGVRTAIISESVAARLWPGRSAVGERVLLYQRQLPFTVVGVVSQIRTVEFARDDVQLFFPVAPANARPGLLIRTAGDIVPLADAIRVAVRAIAPAASVLQIGTVEQLFEELDPIGTPRFYAAVLSLMAVLGLLTAAVGLFGVISHAVSRRTHEIGVRLALGADAGRIRRLMWRDTFRPVAIGLASGLLCATWLSRFLASQLFHVSARDPATYTIVVVVLCAASVIAAYGPVRRATLIDPVDALRAE